MVAGSSCFLKPPLRCGVKEGVEKKKPTESKTRIWGRVVNESASRETLEMDEHSSRGEDDAENQDAAGRRVMEDRMVNGGFVVVMEVAAVAARCRVP